MLRSPRFALVAMGSIGLGIAAVASIFSFVNAILLSPLPVPNAGSVIALEESERGRKANGSPVRLFDWARASSIESVTGFYGESLTVQFGDLPERIPGVRTFGDPLATLGVQPEIGRRFTAEELRGKAGNVVMITDRFWRAKLAADPGVLSRALRINGEPYQVVAVLPPGIDIDDAEILSPEPNQDLPRAARFLAQIARLKPGFTTTQAQAELSSIASALTKQYPDTDAGLSIRVVPYTELISSTARTPLLILLGAVGLVLLMACINVASLSLSRVSGRVQELAVRQALGAGRGRILQLLVSESLVISAAGGILGVVGALWAVDWLRSLAPADLPRLHAVRVDGSVLAFAAVLSMVSALVSGILPSLRASRLDVNESLKNGSRGSVRRHRTQALLVAGQLALSLALLTGGGLLFRSLWNLQNRPLGFAPERLLTFRMSLSWHTEPDQLRALYARVLDRLQSMPGVEGAALADRLPLDGGSMDADVAIAGRAASDLPAGSRLSERVVSTGYHELLRVPLKAGRYLTPADGSEKRTVINEAAARAYFAGQNPLGQRIGLHWQTSRPRPQEYFEIVGVVADLPGKVREDSAEPAMYVPFQQSYWPLANFVVRSRTSPQELVPAIRREMASIDSSQAIELLRTADDFVGSKTETPRLQTWLVAVFAAAALLIAGVGLYGLIAGMVADRSQEIGIRMALGAEPRRVMADVLQGTLRLAVVGAVAGLVLSAIFARAIGSALYHVRASDPLAYSAAAGILLFVSIATAWWPARRASRIDPMRVLRRE